MRITKKITSIVLAVLMVVSMMSVMAVSVNAEVVTDEYVANIGDTFDSDNTTIYFDMYAVTLKGGTYTHNDQVVTDDITFGDTEQCSGADGAYIEIGGSFVHGEDVYEPVDKNGDPSTWYVIGKSDGDDGKFYLVLGGYDPNAAPAHTEHTYVNNPTFNWSQDASTGDWNCNKLTLTCSGCDETQDYEVAGFFGASAVTVTANDDGSFTYTVSKKVDGVTYTDTKTNAANGVIKSTNQLKAAAKKGGSWELGADLTGVTDVQCANGFVLDGKDHKVTRHANVSTQAVFRTTANPAEVTLKNLTIDGIVGKSDSKPAVATKMSNPSAGNVINLENVTITNYDFDASNNGVVLAWGQATVNMKNCTVDTDSDYDVWGGAASTINVDGGKVGTAYLNGGTASAALTNGAVVDNFATSSDNNIKDNGDGTYSVVPKVYVAQVGDNKYESLAEAITAAQDGGTVKLLADQTIDLQLAAGEEYTIDLNSYTLTVESSKSYNYIYGDLTIDDSSDAKTGKVVVDDYGIAPRPGGKVTVNSGSFTTAAGKDYIFYLMGGELEVNGGSFTANHPVNCYSSGKKAYGGKVVINDGDFESTKYFVISGFENSDITINGGEFEGPYPIYVDKTSSLSSGFAPASATINGGTFTATSNGEYGNTIVDCENGASVTIKGGTFTGGDLYADDSSDISVSSGTFDSAVPEEFCAEGFIPKDNGDGTYGVKIGTYVAQIGDNKYETLEEAFAAAQDGDTITVLADCAGNGIKVLKNTFATGLTVDFGGHTYTVDGETVGSPGTETLAFQLQYGNNITFKNGTLYSEKAKMLVQNYSNLTLDGMKLTFNNTSYNGAYTLSNNNGNTVIKDSTINANPTPGSFAFDVCRGGGSNAYPSVNVTVTGNSVINGNVEVYAKNADPKDGFSLKLLSGTMTGNIVVDPTAKAVLDAKSDKGEVTKNNAFGQTAPEGLVWEDNGNGTSSLVPVEVNPLDALITRVSDGNKFGITSQYYAGTILGVQKKEKITNAAVTSDKGTQEAAEGSDMRFVAVLDTETLQGADDYGFVLAKVGSDKNIASVGNEGLDKLKKGDDRFKTISAVNTYNTVCGTSAAAKKYGDPTDATTAYKYITCAVNGVDDSSKIVARFYVVKDGKTYYAKYAGHSYKYRGAVAGISDLG